MLAALRCRTELTARAWGVGVLLALYVAAQGATFFHLVTVKHTLCADHGQVVHGEHAHAPEMAPTASATWSAHPEGDHEHCGLDHRVSPTGLTLEPPAAVPTTATSLALVAPEGRPTDAVLVRAVWRAAPKQSPPRA